MLAAHQELDNLVVIVDNNNLQIDGAIDEVNSPYPIDKKFEAFNFHVINIDGNDFDQIDAAFKEAKTIKGQPTLSSRRQSRVKAFPSWRTRQDGTARRQTMKSMRLP